MAEGSWTCRTSRRPEVHRLRAEATARPGRAPVGTAALEVQGLPHRAAEATGLTVAGSTTSHTATATATPTIAATPATRWITTTAEVILKV